MKYICIVPSRTEAMMLGANAFYVHPKMQIAIAHYLDGSEERGLINLALHKQVKEWHKWYNDKTGKLQEPEAPNLFSMIGQIQAARRRGKHGNDD